MGRYSRGGDRLLYICYKITTIWFGNYLHESRALRPRSWDDWQARITTITRNFHNPSPLERLKRNTTFASARILTEKAVQEIGSSHRHVLEGRAIEAQQWVRNSVSNKLQRNLKRLEK